MILYLLLNKNVYLCKVKYRIHIIGKSSRMELKTLIAECTAYDFKVMLEEKKPKSWLKSVSAFANDGMERKRVMPSTMLSLQAMSSCYFVRP